MAPRAAYNHGTSARKLKQAQPAGLPLSGIQVVKGGRRAERTATSGAVLFARILVAFIAAFALLGCFRITLSSATVAAAMEARQLDKQIDDAREQGSRLEVTQSSLGNPNRVRREALAGGMITPSGASFIDISGDVVQLDEAGNLSLGRTITAVAAKEGLIVPEEE